MTRLRYHRWAIALGLIVSGCAGSGSGTALGNVAALSSEGEFTVMSYTDVPDVPEFGAATIYYPIGTPGPIGGIAIAPGLTERQSHIEWWGRRLASHGYAVLLLDTNDPRDRPDLRRDALLAAVHLLRRENTRQGSRLLGRMAIDKMAVMGHSMGGGGALLAAAEHGDVIRAAIPFTPWERDADFAGITVPTLIIAGETDEIAEVEGHAWRHFMSIPSSTAKVYMEMKDGDHYLADTKRGKDLDTVGRYAIAWLKLHMDGDERYRDFLFGERPAPDASKFSRYVAIP